MRVTWQIEQKSAFARSQNKLGAIHERHGALGIQISCVFVHGVWKFRGLQKNWLFENSFRKTHSMSFSLKIPFCGLFFCLNIQLKFAPFYKTLNFSIWNCQFLLTTSKNYSPSYRTLCTCTQHWSRIDAKMFLQSCPHRRHKNARPVTTVLNKTILYFGSVGN